MTARRVLPLAFVVLVALLVPGPVAAGPPATTAPPTTTPAATTVPSTTVPATTVPAAPPPAETTVAVGDEAAYRAALASLSGDASGPHTIDLTADITVDDGTDPTYTGTETLTIDGHGFALEGVSTSRLLAMDSPTDAALTLSDLTVRRGSTSGDGGGVFVGNASTVELVDTWFEANAAFGSGGAIAVPEVASVLRSDFTGNLAVSGDGGAIDAATPGGDFVIQESQFVANRAPAGDGGAVSAIGSGSPATGGGVQRSTFFGNQARRGGGLVLTSGGTVTNSTIIENHASVIGGGILAEGRDIAAGIYLTVTGNTAPEGANLALTGRELSLFFSVFAEPAGGGENCSLVGPSQFNEVHADDDSCPGGGNNGGPALLGPLIDNGGRTLTRSPLPGSPLIDAVPAGYGFPSIPGGCARWLTLEPPDQRGVERPQDGDGETRTDSGGGEPIEVAADCDIGAVEARALVAPPTGPVPAGPPFTG